MVSFSDHEDFRTVHLYEREPKEKPQLPKRIFVFIDGEGASHHIEARNVTDAWISLSFREEAEVEALVYRGWRVEFDQ